MESNTRIARGHRLRLGRQSISNHAYLITSAVLERRPVFLDPGRAQAACRTFADSAWRCDARLLTWVLMPDHAHWVIQIGGLISLSRVVQQLKGASAHAVGIGNLWQRGYHDRMICSEESLRTRCRYVVANPIRAGLVDSVGDYPYWDAVWL